MSGSAVIMGGGLGGLVTGAILAREGIKVTVLEKNVIPGGGLQSFKRFSEVFDTGMHIVGGLQEGGRIRKLCKYLGILDKMNLAAVDRDYSNDIYFAQDDVHYRLSSGKENYIKTLAEQFPGQEAALRAYVDAMYRICDEVDLFYLRPSSAIIPDHSGEFMMAADAFVAKYIEDERLRAVVSYMNPLYGGMGAVTPAYVHALISVLYLEGTYRFEGGSVRFADTLIEAIEDNGGTVLCGEAVVKVITEGRKIISVTGKSGRSYVADHYICDIHPCTFIKLLDTPTALPKSYRERLESIPGTHSAFTVNIKFKSGTFPYLNHSGYYMSSYDKLWRFCDDDSWPHGFLYMTTPQLNQGEFASTMTLTAPMKWSQVSQWENTVTGHRGQQYEDWKKERASQLLACMEKIFPGFTSKIEAIDTASPLTIRDFYGVKEGSMSGFLKDCNNPILTQLPVFTKIPNLLLTGQNCSLHGFCGVILTAITTSEAILGQNYIINRINEVTAQDI